jgi:hypothetical protein
MVLFGLNSKDMEWELDGKRRSSSLAYIRGKRASQQLRKSNSIDFILFTALSCV